MLQHLIFHFSHHSLSSGHLRLRLKTKENFLLFALKVVALTYEKRSLTRGSKYSDLTWKLLVFWKTGCRGEVVADKSLSDSVQVVVTPAAPQK